MENNSSIKIKDFIIKLSVVIIGLGFWMIYRIFYLTDKVEPWDYKYCFKDKLLTDVLKDFTDYLSQNLTFRDFILITGSNLLDIFFISFLINYVIKGRTWNAICHFILFYGIRVLIQNIITLGFYDTYLFTNPEFPSIIVPYFRAADFFYSGHAGCCLLIGLQFYDLGYNELFYVGILLSLYEGFVMTSIRAHYSIDVIFGLLIAHYTYFLANDLGKFMDKCFPICGEKLNKIDGSLKIQKEVVINVVQDDLHTDSN